MTNVAPTLQKPNPPTLLALLETLERQILKEMNCVRIGQVQSFNPGGVGVAPTAIVRIAQQQVTSIAPDGTKTLAEYPLLVNVPVWFTGGGGYTATFPIRENDECIILFNDRNQETWLQVGAGQAPPTGRVHDLSDAICLVGLRSNPRALAGISTTAMQVRSDNYTGPTGTGECIEIGPGKIQIIADEVVTHARNKATFDAGGTGFVYTPAEIDTYTDGVTTNHHNPSPPEVPT